MRNKSARTIRSKKSAKNAVGVNIRCRHFVTIALVVYLFFRYIKPIMDAPPLPDPTDFTLEYVAKVWFFDDICIKIHLK